MLYHNFEAKTIFFINNSINIMKSGWTGFRKFSAFRGSTSKSQDIRDSLSVKHQEYGRNVAPIPRPFESNFTYMSHKGTIFGSIPGNFNSSEYLLEKLDKMSPAVVCISLLHPLSYLSYKYCNTPKQYENLSLGMNQEKLLPIREKFKGYFANELRRTFFHFTDDFGVFYLVDPVKKELLPDDGLTAVNWGSESNQAGVVAAGAHPLAIHEDLIHNISLPRLKEIFHTSLNKHLARAKSLGFEPSINTAEFYYYLTISARLHFQNELLRTRNIYTAAVLKKTLGNFDNVALVHDHNECELLLNILLDEKTPDFDTIFIGKEYNGSFEEAMEKIVILSQIDNRFFRQCMEMGENPLKIMFNGSMKNSLEEVKEAFKHFNKEYSGSLTKGLIQEIERIPTFSRRGRNIFSAFERAKEIEQRTGLIRSGHIHDSIEDEFLARVLFAQMQVNIDRKIRAGISQAEEIIALQQLMQGKPTALNVEILKKLSAEANAQLGLMKMPESLAKYTRMLVNDTTPKELLRISKNMPVKVFSPDDAKNKGTYLYDKNNPPREISDRDAKYTHFVIGKGEFPYDLKGKTPEELKALGAKEVFNNTYQSNPNGRLGLGTFKEARQAARDLEKGLDLEEVLKSQKPQETK
ncbi:unnamed protein product [Blepharisma stoltei]|uniref:Uncharacterized protein n=1 Tax=Blepharisma stoltei TaxID=1481888 RepID=A0AAU9JN43_9CILI|nr:unnamed protein product [Blepharisma stoltei]